MLYEGDVVEAVRRQLVKTGYEVGHVLTTTQRGHDIIARKKADPGWELYIEAKGEGSSRVGSARYGASFSSGQVFDHVAKAVLKALRVASWEEELGEKRSAIALPANDMHVREIEMVAPALKRAGIAVFWVSPNRAVRVDSPWRL